MKNRLQYTNDDLDIFGVKRTIEPNEFQIEMMNHIGTLANIEIIHDRIRCFALLGRAGNQYNGFLALSEYNPHLEQDLIVINTHANTSGWYQVLFHELAHASGMASRLNRPHVNCLDRTEKNRCIEEYIADITSVKLMEYLEFDDNQTKITHSLYLVGNFHPGIQSREIRDSIDFEVQRAFDYVLNNWLYKYDRKKSAIAA